MGVQDSSGKITIVEVEGLRKAGGDPAEDDSVTNEVSLPAASSDATEIMEVSHRVIIDTGTRCNLVGLKAARRFRNAFVRVEPREFSTANGRVVASTALLAKISSMGGRNYHFHILQNSPMALSLGTRVEEENVIFVWVPKKETLVHFR